MKSKQWHKENKERIRKRKAQYYQDNKEAFARRQKERQAREKDGHYSVYYLPNECYVGMTDTIVGRMRAHKHNGMDTTNMEIIGVFDCPILAHQEETLWHTRGMLGFHYTNNKIRRI